MPCDSGMSYGSNYDHEARRELERLTRVSCDIMKAIEGAGVRLNLSGEASKWWEAHKLIDAERERVAAEQRARHELAEAAKAKLTPAERAALGIRS